MNLSDVRDLFAYDAWANERVVECLKTLDAESFSLHLGGSHRSIRETFAHIVGAEWIWLERWVGDSPSAPPPWLESTELAELTGQMRLVSQRRASFIEALSEADLDRVVEFTLLSGKRGSRRLRDLFVQVVNHSTFHRGQLISMLRQLGVQPPATDFFLYCDERTT